MIEYYISAMLNIKSNTKISTLLVVSLFFILVSFLNPPVLGESCNDISDKSAKLECFEKQANETREKLNEVGDKLDSVLSEISKLANQLNVTQSELNNVQSSINNVVSELNIINSNLSDRQEKLSDKISFRNSLLRNYAKKSSNSTLEMFFSPSPIGSGFGQAAFLYVFNRSVNAKVLSSIDVLNNEITEFEKQKKEAEELKKELETAQANLISLTSSLAAKKGNVEEEGEKLEEEKTQYEEELEDLQDKILELKSGGGNGTVGEYAATKVKIPDAPFKPAFAALSYGAYSHYKGMSQYGAKGRAEDGESYEDIIKFYYKTDVDKKDLPGKLCVEGYGNMDFQTYLYGLGEMPSDWPEDALKAQAIAARSYAYRYAKAGKCICTTQSCQVFVKSKSDKPPSRWKKAVDDTKGMVLKNSDIVAYYSSTTGGYIENIGWDTKDSWPGGAYENKANSPWFRKAWYTKSYSDNSTCGRSYPWLSEEEMADILNSYVVYTKGSSKDKSHISPLTKSCWGGDPYSIEKMRETADKYGDGYSKVTSIKATVSDGGYTSVITLGTDKGSVSVDDGQTFKTVFNLRAPAYVAIRSRIFDFEHEK